MIKETSCQGVLYGVKLKLSLLIIKMETKVELLKKGQKLFLVT